jgi:hypothetical protein
MTKARIKSKKLFVLSNFRVFVIEFFASSFLGWGISFGKQHGAPVRSAAFG